MSQAVPRGLDEAVAGRLRGTAVVALEWTRNPANVSVFGTVAMGLVMLVLLSLALLPTGESCLSKTVSVAVYGPYGELVPLVLLVFGVGAAALGRALALRLNGRPGVICGRCVFVWATVSLIDAVVPTNPTGEHTVHGEVHIVLAITGLVAQVFVAVYYAVVLHRLHGRIPRPVLAAALFVLAAGGFFAAHPEGLAGLAERLLFASSAVWTITAVGAAGRPRVVDCQRTEGRWDAQFPL
jgi:hypothetical protein